MKLFYFTASYPYGIGEKWKSNELKELVSQFEEIVVVPYANEGNFDHPKTLPPGVRLAGPLFNSSSFTFSKTTGLLKVLSSRYRSAFLKEFFTRKVYRKKSHLASWLHASMNVLRIMERPVMQQIIAGLDKQTILYFFWGKGSAEMLPFIDTSRCFKTFVRMHRYDLFESVNDHYIPYRRPLLENIDVAAPSSEAGKRHLQELYPDLSKKIKLYRLGTVGNGKTAAGSTDNMLRVVSCSYLSPVKRVHLMVESLRYIDFPILWRHVGDGKERVVLERLIKEYSLEDKFIIEGMIDTDSLLDFYTDNVFDLFVNVSASEGVPMSIMEAFSVSIPVMATRVGGNGEVVDDEVGRILPADLTPEMLAAALKEYYRLPAASKSQIRLNALAKANEQCDAVKLAVELAYDLKHAG